MSLAIDLPSQCDEPPVSHPIEGLKNYRQVTTPGGRIKPGILFRSDQLYDLSETAVTDLNALGLETIVDLRSHDELETHPNLRIDSVDFDVNLPIGSNPADIEKIMPLEVAAQIRPMWVDGKFEEFDKLLEDHDVDLNQTRINCDQDFATKFDPQVSRFLHLLTDSNDFPLLFHCAGGKDRTGFMAAVTLLTLGYSKEDVVRDYLSTNVYTFVELENWLGKALNRCAQHLVRTPNRSKHRCGSSQTNTARSKPTGETFLASAITKSMRSRRTCWSRTRHLKAAFRPLSQNTNGRLPLSSAICRDALLTGVPADFFA